LHYFLIIEHLDTTNKKKEQVDDDIDRLKNTSKQLLQMLRETIWILNKEEVSIEDFFDKLIEYTSRYLQSYPKIHLEIEEKFSESAAINSNHTLQLFRICQEAINNACKYSDSDTIIIKGDSGNKGIQIVIEDKGIGFDTSSIVAGDHYGLRNMKQRAESMGASLTIISAKEKGTIIEIYFKA